MPLESSMSFDAESHKTAAGPTTWASERTARREPVSEKHAKRLVNIVHAFVSEVTTNPAVLACGASLVGRAGSTKNEDGKEGIHTIGDEMYFSPGFRCKMASVLFAYSGRLIDRVIDRSIRRGMSSRDPNVDGVEDTRKTCGLKALSVEDLREEIIESAGRDLWDCRIDVLENFSSGRSIPSSFFKWLTSPYIVRKDFMIDLFAVLLALIQKTMLVHMAPVASRREGQGGHHRKYIRERTLVMALGRTKVIRDKTYNNFQRFDPRLSMTLLGVDASNPGMCEPVDGMPRFKRRCKTTVDVDVSAVHTENAIDEDAENAIDEDAEKGTESGTESEKGRSSETPIYAKANAKEDIEQNGKNGIA